MGIIGRTDRRDLRRSCLGRRLRTTTAALALSCGSLAIPSQATVIVLGINPVATSANWETNPVIGTDNDGSYVVYTSQPVLNTTDTFLGYGSIFMQRLKNGQAFRPELKISADMTNNQLPAADGGNILYTAFGSTQTLSGGTVMRFQTSTDMNLPVTDFGRVREARINGNYFAFVAGNAGETTVRLMNFDWLGTGIAPVIIGGPVPAATSVEIGSRFVVWDERVGIDRFVVAYDRVTGARQVVANDPTRQERLPATSGSWVTWESQVVGGTSMEIFAKNLDTGEERTVAANGARNLTPAIDGDFVFFESDVGDPGGNFDIWGYRLSTSYLFRVTDLPGDQYQAYVHGDLVSWVNDTAGNPDIYVGRFSVIPDDVGMPEPPMLALILAGGLLAAFARRRSRRASKGRC